MRDDGPDAGRRRFLTTAATVVGGVGLVGAATPFVATWLPSERSRAFGAPVEVDISQLQPGERIIAEWRGRPVWIFRRDETMLGEIATLNDQVKDPDSVEEQQPPYAKNEGRAINPEYFVVIGVCTHLGCSPSYADRDAENLGEDWKGGFFCPCHFSRFDLAGRVYKGAPAPRNLVVPPHRYLSPGRILIGEDAGSA